jgi:2-amino-4-hydroxy-6-hydroxymethyldihydropteridine diphosphokinase
MPLQTVYLSLGSNLGDRRDNLTSAVARLERAYMTVWRTSSLYETEPVDLTEQPWFLNIVLQGEVKVSSPFELLDATQAIEQDLGRTREGSVHRGPRVIDIDILLFGEFLVTDERLTIPHPRMTVRRFVLEPLVEIAPDVRHPETGVPFRDFLTAVSGQHIQRLVHG